MELLGVWASIISDPAGEARDLKYGLIFSYALLWSLLRSSAETKVFESKENSFRTVETFSSAINMIILQLSMDCSELVPKKARG